MICRLITIIIRKICDTDHGWNDLRDDEDSAPQDDQNENCRNGVLQQLKYRLEYSVKSTCTDCESVKSISPHVVPKLFHKWPFRPKSQRLLVIHPHQKQHKSYGNRSNYQTPWTRLNPNICGNFIGWQVISGFGIEFSDQSCLVQDIIWLGEI